MGRSKAGRSAEADPHPLINGTEVPLTTSGITSPFGNLPKQMLLSRCSGYVTHALLTLSPLNCRQLPKNSSVRLACLSHAASVRSEPGSNSSIEKLIIRPNKFSRNESIKKAQTFHIDTRMFESGALLQAHTLLCCQRTVTSGDNITLSWRPTVGFQRTIQAAKPSSGQPRTEHCRDSGRGVNHKNRLFFAES